MNYRYNLKSTGNSSIKYGKCEVCKQHATEVFRQSEEREYAPGKWSMSSIDLFGHEQCLISRRAVN